MAYVDTETLKRNIRVNFMPNVDIDRTVTVENAERYFLNLIDKTSTADVVEVKHGRWQIEDRGGKPTERPICSQCGATPKYYVNGKSSPYCQECGSKMNINVVPYRGAIMDGKDNNVPANGRSDT